MKGLFVHRNIGIRGSNAKYETGMKELTDSSYLSLWGVTDPAVSDPLSR